MVCKSVIKDTAIKYFDRCVFNLFFLSNLRQIAWNVCEKILRTFSFNDFVCIHISSQKIVSSRTY